MLAVGHRCCACRVAPLIRGLPARPLFALFGCVNARRASRVLMASPSITASRDTSRQAHVSRLGVLVVGLLRGTAVASHRQQMRHFLGTLPPAEVFAVMEHAREGAREPGEECNATSVDRHLRDMLGTDVRRVVYHLLSAAEVSAQSTVCCTPHFAVHYKVKRAFQSMALREQHRGLLFEHVLRLRVDSLCSPEGDEHRITHDDPYFQAISSSWGDALKNAFHSLPDYSFYRED